MYYILIKDQPPASTLYSHLEGRGDKSEQVLISAMKRNVVQERREVDKTTIMV